MNAFVPDHPGCRVVPSPNFGARIKCARPSMIILHYTGTCDGVAAQNLLCNPASRLSSHHLVYEDGDIVQLVQEKHRAWHAGVSYWKGVQDVNSASVGIEIANPGYGKGYHDFPLVQMKSVVRLCQGIIERYGILPERVLGHSDVAPGRKVDPGHKFDWAFLASEGVGHYVPPVYFDEDVSCARRVVPAARIQLFKSLLADYGYGYAGRSITIGSQMDDEANAVISSFQQHFRSSKVDGVVDLSTLRTLQNLIGALPRFA